MNHLESWLFFLLFCLLSVSCLCLLLSLYEALSKKIKEGEGEQSHWTEAEMSAVMVVHQNMLLLPFGTAANRRDSPIENREEERASFILSPFECGTQSPQLSQLPLVTSVITDQSTYSVHCTVAWVQCLAPFGAQWQLTQLWTLSPTFEGREYKGSAFFFPLFYGPVPSIRRDSKGEHILFCGLHDEQSRCRPWLKQWCQLLWWPYFRILYAT